MHNFITSVTLNICIFTAVWWEKSKCILKIKEKTFISLCTDDILFIPLYNAITMLLTNEKFNTFSVSAQCGD